MKPHLNPLTSVVKTLGFGCVLLALVTVRLFSQAALKAGIVQGYPGITVSVPVLASNVPNVTAMQFDVAYDATKISAGDSILGLRLTNHSIRSHEITPGLQRVIIYSLANSTLGRTNPQAAVIPFAVSPNERVSSGPIVPSRVMLSLPNASAVAPTVTTTGEIFIVPTYVLPDGSAQFFFQSLPGSNYVVQASGNLVDWTNISTNMATSDFLDLVDADAVFYPWRFYRLRAE